MRSVLERVTTALRIFQNHPHHHLDELNSITPHSMQLAAKEGWKSVEKLLSRANAQKLMCGT